jgi:hypothetical protein
MKPIRRSFLRRYRQVPVEIRQDDRGGPFQANMSDCCRGGMQLATEQSIEPGSAVVIRAKGLHDIFMDEVIHQAYAAEVVWCQRLAGSRSDHFAVGVRFVLPDPSRPSLFSENHEVLETSS